MLLIVILILLVAGEYPVSPNCHDTAAHCPEGCQCPVDTGGGLIVDCRGSELQAIPENLPSGTSILDLHGNNIKALLKESLVGCHELRYLDLSDNEIAEIDYDFFKDVIQVETLLMQGNKLNFNVDTVPRGSFDPLIKLSKLNIKDNRWIFMDTLRYDIFQNKPFLEDISFDVPSTMQSFGDEMSALQSLQTLHISGGIKSIQNETFVAFTNISVTELAIIGTPLTQIEMLAFSPFPRIKSLDLSNNNQLGLNKNQTWQKSWYGLRNSSLTVLKLNEIVKSFDYNPYTIPDHFCQYLNNTPLKELYMDVNGLVKVNVKFHKCFPHLEKLSLAYNRFLDNIKYILLDVYKLGHLKYLDLSQQSKFPIARDPNVLGNVNSRGDKNLLVYFAPQVEYVNLSAAFPASYHIINNIYWFCRTTHMEILDVSGNKMNEIRGQVIPYPNMSLSFSTFNMSNCGLKEISVNLFTPLWTYHTIDLRGNQLGSCIERDIHGQLLEQLNQGSCRELNIASNGIKSLPQKFLSYVNTLEIIVFRDNALSVWQTSVATLVNLTLLDLSENLIPYLEAENRREFDDIASNIPLQLDLAGNPLECECHSLAFLEWMESTKVHIIGRDNYTCHMSGGLVNLGNLTQIVDHLTIQCSSKTWVNVTGLLCAGMVLVVFVTVLVYRYRWDIRYCFLKFRRQRQAYYSLTDDRDFIFDAFVAYHQHEMSWIQNELIPNLEDNSNPISLCIHHRNWLPGPPIAENISYSVENCRKTLALISPSFLQSGWCKFELEMARLRGFEEDQQIIVVVALEEIPMERMSRTLVHLRRTHVWLDWFEHEDNREQFWNLLRGALRAPVTERQSTELTEIV